MLGSSRRSPSRAENDLGRRSPARSSTSRAPKRCRVKYLEQILVLIGLFVTSMLVAQDASALIVSGPHTTELGRVVDLGGLEWLSFDETFGVTRDEIEAGHDDLLLQGWRYATTVEFTRLISSLWGNVDGYQTENFDGSQWLWENFDNPDFLQHDFPNSRTGDIFVGAAGECGGVDESCRGHWRAYDDADSGWFNSNFGAQGYTGTLSNTFETAASSALVRAVPEPSTLLLLSLGLVGISLRKR